MRALRTLLVLLAFSPVLAVPARAGDGACLMVHDAGALLGVSDAVLEESVRAEAPESDRLVWLATLVQARRECRVAEGAPEDRGLTVTEIARWVEINCRDVAGPDTLVRPAVRGVCVVGEPKVHRQAAALLSALRAAVWTCHRFEITLAAYEPAFLSRLDTRALIRLGEERIPGFRMSAEQAGPFVAGLADGAHLVDRGQGVLSVAWGEEGRFSLVREVAHAAAVETHFAFGRAFGVPRQGTVEDGLRFRGRVIDPQEKSIAFHVNLDIALLAGLESFSVPSGTVEIPSILRRSLGFVERLAPGEAFGVLGLEDPFGVETAPRGRRAGGMARNLLVVVRYLGKQVLLAETPLDDLVHRAWTEPGRAVPAPVATDPAVAEVYDVTDLAVSVPDFASSLRRGPGGLEPAESGGKVADREADGTGTLADLIRVCVAPDWWATAPAASLEVPARGAIAVAAPATVHETIRALLLDLRDLEANLISTRVHVVLGRLEPGAPRASHLLRSLARNRSLSPQEMTAHLEKAFRAQGGFRPLAAPTLSTFPGQKASILIADQIAYLKDHTLEEGPSGVVLDPVIGTIQEGLLLQLRACALPGGGWIRLTGSLELAQLDEAMHKHSFGAPSDAGRGETIVTLEMPTCRRVIHEFTEVVQRNQAVLIAVPGVVRNLFGGAKGRSGANGEAGLEEVYLLIRAGTFDARKSPTAAEPTEEKHD